MNNNKQALREALQAYLDEVHPSSTITRTHSLGASVHIRFELGGTLKNGTKERANQAVERALTLFEAAFSNQEQEIWVLAYEYEDVTLWGASTDYFYQQFPAVRLANFYQEKEELSNSLLTKAEEEPHCVKVIIGHLPLSEINVAGILRGLANTEMGLEPSMTQRVFFFDPATDNAFHLYDDRGCYIWSNQAEKIRGIYERWNDWIVDYHRPEIDSFFME